MEDLEKLNASEIYPRIINAKDVLIRQTNDEFIFSAAAKLSGRDYEFREPTPRWEPTALGGEDFSRELQGEPGESQLQNQQMTLNPVQTSGRSKVTSSIVITNDPRVQLFVLKEETFPIPLKYIDVTRSTHTDLDVL